MAISITTDNSYNTAEEIQEYMDYRLNADAWTNASDDDRIRAAVSATKEIDDQDIIGEKLDSSQSLQFPRDFETTVAENVKKCQCELILELLEENYSLNSKLNNGLTSKSIDGVSETYNNKKMTGNINLENKQRKAFRFIKDYLYCPTVQIR